MTTYLKYFYHKDTKELMPKSLFIKLINEYGNAADVKQAAEKLGYRFHQEATVLTLTDHIVMSEQKRIQWN